MCGLNFTHRLTLKLTLVFMGFVFNDQTCNQRLVVKNGVHSVNRTIFSTSDLVLRQISHLSMEDMLHKLT